MLLWYKNMYDKCSIIYNMFSSLTCTEVRFLVESLAILKETRIISNKYTLPQKQSFSYIFLNFFPYFSNCQNLKSFVINRRQKCDAVIQFNSVEFTYHIIWVCAWFCVCVCVWEKSKPWPSRFPSCRQGQQQAAALLAGNQPNLDPRGQPSASVCASVCVRTYCSICASVTTDWWSQRHTWWATLLISPPIFALWARFFLFFLIECIFLIASTSLNLWRFDFLMKILLLRWSEFQDVCRSVGLFLPAGMSEPCISSLGGFNTFTAGIPQS